MNSDIPEQPTLKEPSSKNRLKRPLIAFLFVSAITGYSFSFFISRPSETRYCTIIKRPVSEPGKPVRSPEVRKKTVFSGKEKPVTCQGVVTTESGQRRAVFNGKAVAPGKKAGPVRILEVTASNVLVECNGQQRHLSPGESFVPGKCELRR